ncbi:conserved hypothetical protein [Gluconacetobacter diazotrophicus PA1 5]|uniref:Uncharacterized protein n=1 Tax=Gluconacetobacter diazotrophicus (strain ATCC 49037 / DSM 5601 / CCUG 37298 / CIP 103539 / LMG 7603 / PAl5) TaxID=272568 RepID=A9HAS7_GLUDA|nr:conserved hypothetical protein [Gluconacetobacter diazotrophicus PA1 5]
MAPLRRPLRRDRGGRGGGGVPVRRHRRSVGHAAAVTALAPGPDFHQCALHHAGPGRQRAVRFRHGRDIDRPPAATRHHGCAVRRTLRQPGDEQRLALGAGSPAAPVPAPSCGAPLRADRHRCRLVLRRAAEPVHRQPARAGLDVCRIALAGIRGHHEPVRGAGSREPVHVADRAQAPALRHGRLYHLPATRQPLRSKVGRGAVPQGDLRYQHGTRARGPAGVDADAGRPGRRHPGRHHHDPVVSPHGQGKTGRPGQHRRRDPRRLPCRRHRDRPGRAAHHGGRFRYSRPGHRNARQFLGFDPLPAVRRPSGDGRSGRHPFGARHPAGTRSGPGAAALNGAQIRPYCQPLVPPPSSDKEDGGSKRLERR